MQTEEMQPETGHLSQDEAKEYLANLQGLAAELNRAMEAIVKRELPSFQDSLHLQQSKSARLADLRHASRLRLVPGSMPATGPVDSDLASEIQAATDTLLLLNRRYSALLKHSGDTLRLLAGLYRSYRASGQPGSGIRANLQTWSCEV
jgi:hypothetical protein